MTTTLPPTTVSADRRTNGPDLELVPEPEIRLTNPAWAPANDLLDRLRELAPRIEASAAEAEQLRTSPPALIDELRDAGCFRLALGRELGGEEIHPVTLISVMEEISRADGSAGWTAVIGNAACFFHWLDPDVALDLLGASGDAISSAVFAPTGTAVPDGDGGFVINGRWAFNSGCLHSNWHQVGVLVMDGDHPARRGDGRIDHRFVFVADADVTIVDTWDPLGLRGTGSHDLVIEDLRVPETHTAAPLMDRSRALGPSQHLPFMASIAMLMAGFPLGVGRRALDELAERASAQTRTGSATSIAEDPHTQVLVGQAEAGLRSARAWMIERARAVAALCEAGREPSEAQVAELELAFRQCFEAARVAATTAFDCAGSAVVAHDDVIQRCLRDLLTASKHVGFNTDRWRWLARLTLAG